MRTPPIDSTTRDGAAPDLLVLGHVTRDVILGEERLGGAAAFAAQAAALLGYRTALVTAAPPSPLLAALETNPRITLHRTDCEAFTTFALDYGGLERRISLLARAPDIDASHLPCSVQSAPVVYLGPVISEFGSALVQTLADQYVVMGAQGWMREVCRDGRVMRISYPESRVPSGAHVVVFSELDCDDPEAVGRNLARTAQVVAITRAERGVTLIIGGDVIDLPAEPAREVDPTGAGDVFGVVFGLELHAGSSVLRAARRAMWAAARVVEGPGLGTLVPRARSRRQTRRSRRSEPRVQIRWPRSA